MLLAFFESKGYSHVVPRGSTINMVYIVKVLNIFTNLMKKKKSILVGQGWFSNGIMPLFMLGTLFDPCRLAYLAYTSND